MRAGFEILDTSIFPILTVLIHQNAVAVRRDDLPMGRGFFIRKTAGQIGSNTLAWAEADPVIMAKFSTI